MGLKALCTTLPPWSSGPCAVPLSPPLVRLRSFTIQVRIHPIKPSLSLYHLRLQAAASPQPSRAFLLDRLSVPPRLYSLSLSFRSSLEFAARSSFSAYVE